MKFSNSLKTAVVGLTTNKARSALTVLGIVIGIASVILMMSLGQGVQNLIVGQIVSMGSNTIFVEPGSFDGKAGGGSMMQSMSEEMSIKTLTYEDAVAIKRESTVKYAAAATFGSARAVYRNADKKITYMGITPDMLKINDVRPIAGRDFTEADTQGAERVAYLGYKISSDLFGEEDPVGKTIRVKNVNFLVIGVAEEQGTQMFMNLDESIYVPLKTAQRLLLGTEHVQWIVVQAKSDDVINETVENIRLLLRERHNIYNPEGDLSKDDFKAVSQVETTEMLTTITGVLTMFLSSIAAIALLVGGIGIMNIMLVSVTERTREIGLRKAIGARKRDIMLQFLMEATMLTSLGGATGIALGALGAYGTASILRGIEGFSDWQMVIPLNSVIMAFSIAMAIGIVFGIYPARKASKLDPISALRYE